MESLHQFSHLKNDIFSRTRAATMAAETVGAFPRRDSFDQLMVEKLTCVPALAFSLRELFSPGSRLRLRAASVYHGEEFRASASH